MESLKKRRALLEIQLARANGIQRNFESIGASRLFANELCCSPSVFEAKSRLLVHCKCVFSCVVGDFLAILAEAHASCSCRLDAQHVTQWPSPSHEASRAS